MSLLLALVGGGGGATHYTLSCDPGVFLIAGADRNFRTTRSAQLEAGSFLVAGSSREFRKTMSLSCDSASFSIVGRARDFAVNVPIGPGYWSGIVDSVAVCNMALSAIGARARIADIEEQSAEAAECNLHYAQTLVELLRVSHWSWARREEVLAVHKARAGTPENPSGSLAGPPRPWSYSYTRPTDCVRARYIVPLEQNVESDSIPLTTAGDVITSDVRTPSIRFVESGDRDSNGNPIKVILTNAPRARLVYTALITDPTVWDSLFVTAFIGRLAGKICIALSGDKKMMQMAVQMGNVAESEAKAYMATEGIHVAYWTPDAVAEHGYDDEEIGSDYVSKGIQEID